MITVRTLKLHIIACIDVHADSVEHSPAARALPPLPTRIYFPVVVGLATLLFSRYMY